MTRSLGVCCAVILALGAGAGCDTGADDTASFVDYVETRLAAGRVAYAASESLLGESDPTTAQEDPFPEQLSFPVPQRCHTNPTLCCGYYCEIEADLAEQQGDLPRVEITTVDPAGPVLGVTIRARINTKWAMPAVQRWLLGRVDCLVYIDSRWSGWPHMKMYFELHFAPDAEAGGLRAEVKNADAYGVTAGDVSIWGDWLCNRASEADAASELMWNFRQRLPDEIEKLLCQTCEHDDECGEFATCSGSGICKLASGRCLQGT